VENHVDDIKTNIAKLRSTISKELSKKLDLNKCERVVDKLDSFSASCEECQQHLVDLKNHFTQLEVNVDEIDKGSKHHKQVIQAIVAHLQKEHKLVPEGFYLSLYMSIGMSIGVVFGLTIIDNFALGISFGMSMGIALGAGLDADAKKKGNTI
jgi:vacuolar-type H+-ATPase subunit I/STV1